MTLPLAAVLASRPAVATAIQSRKGGYEIDVGLFYNLVSLKLKGTIAEVIDRGSGTYAVTAAGEGAGIANRVESSGRLQDGRWAPLRTTGWFRVRGRESRSEVVYDYAQRTIGYRFRGETFFLRRVRVVDDRVAIPEGRHVDDVISALLNYAEGHWKAEPAGTFRTWVARRHKPDDEKPDDIETHPRAEIVPFEFRVVNDPATGKATALFDMTRFSSWATRDRPARVVFGDNRRPEAITAPLILGTSVTMQFRET